MVTRDPPAPTALETPEEFARRICSVRTGGYSDFVVTDNVASIARLIEADRAAVRERALEEAAREFDQRVPDDPETGFAEIAAQIRSLKKGPTHGSRDVGRELRRQRSSAGLTMGDIAARLGCDVMRVSDIERGYCCPTDAEIARFRAAIAEGNVSHGG